MAPFSGQPLHVTAQLYFILSDKYRKVKIQVLNCSSKHFVKKIKLNPLNIYRYSEDSLNVGMCVDFKHSGFQLFSSQHLLY